MGTVLESLAYTCNFVNRNPPACRTNDIECVKFITGTDSDSDQEVCGYPLASQS